MLWQVDTTSTSLPRKMWLSASDLGFRRQGEEEEEEEKEKEEEEAYVVRLPMNCGNRGLGAGVLHLRFGQV